jgi:hypothetical protein
MHSSLGARAAVSVGRHLAISQRIVPIYGVPRRQGQHLGGSWLAAAVAEGGDSKRKDA